MRIVNIANRARLPHIWTDELVGGLRALGDFELIEWGSQLGDDEAADVVRRANVAREVGCYSGTIGPFVPRELVAEGIPVSNWGDLPAHGVAEGALTLLLAMLHELPRARDVQRAGGHGIDRQRQASPRDRAGFAGGQPIDDLFDLDRDDRST